MEPIRRTKYDIYPFISPRDGLAGAARGKSVLVTGGGKGIGKVLSFFLLPFLLLSRPVFFFIGLPPN